MEKIGITLEKYTEQKPKKSSERSELLGYFFDSLVPLWKGKRKLSIGYVAKSISHLSVKDLYYLKSICDDAKRRGGSFSACFWGSLKSK